MRERAPSIFVYIFFSLIIISLFYAQIIMFGYYHRLARNNAIRIIPIDGPRGGMYDRNGMPLVTSRLSFDVAVVYQELSQTERLISLLTQRLGIPRKEILRGLENAKAKAYAPSPIAEDVDKEKAIMLEEASSDIRGLVIKTRSKRDYIYNEAGAHVFGYLSEISEEELEGMRDYGYSMRDYLGREGLEKYYDSYLTGTDGGLQIEVDNRGRQVRTIGLKEPSSGKDLYLTIDTALQLASDKLLGEHNGAVIVMNPKTGEILALTSHPSFDPNIFIRPKGSAERVKLLKDAIGRSLSNRAVSGIYPPGSVFKVVTASSALETGRISASTHFFCPGSYSVGGAKFNCWKEAGHGAQDVKGALMNSCNVFFYRAGKAAGVDSLEAYAKLFGFGKLTGIDLPDEVKGIVPGRAWKGTRKKDSWYEGETLNYAIGQGYLTVTPIQVLGMMAIIANKGSLVRPYIVRRIGSTDIPRPKPNSIGLKDSTIKIVGQGLVDVVNVENGTGVRAKLDGVLVAGKTGTAQNTNGRTHAWFSGYAPYDDPKICLVVFLEHGGKGSLEPAEIAHGIFKVAKKEGYL